MSHCCCRKRAAAAVSTTVPRIILKKTTTDLPDLTDKENIRAIRSIRVQKKDISVIRTTYIAICDGPISV
jgi:hypothetical protein